MDQSPKDEVAAEQTMSDVERAEALKGLWAQMSVVHKVDFEGIGRRVFGSIDGPPSKLGAQAGAVEWDRLMRDATAAALGRFVSKHASWQARVRKLVVIAVPLIAVFGGTALIGGATGVGMFTADVIDAYYLINGGISIALAVTTGAVGYYLIRWMLDKSLIATRWAPFRLADLRLAFPSLVIGLVSVATLYIVNRSAELIADGRSHQLALIDIASAGLSAGRPCLRPEAAYGYLAITCNAREAIYVASAGGERKKPEWSVVVRNLGNHMEAQVIWSKKNALGWESPVTWNLLVGEAVKVDSTEVRLKDASGNVVAVPPEKNVELPKLGEKAVALQLTGENPQPAKFLRSFWP